MKFLITAEPEDSHAILVKICLEERGHQVRLLFTADLPVRQKNSIYIDALSGYQWKSTDKFHTITENDYDVVWWRSAQKPYLASGMNHVENGRFIGQENVSFLEAITSNLAPDAWWINNKDAAARAKSKLVQLRLAIESGMSIPVTLCSSNPIDIRNFLLQHEAHGVLYKPLSVPALFEGKVIDTGCQLSFLTLPDNKSLQYLPGIYQKQIKKKYGLTVICFGDYLVAAKRNPHRYDGGAHLTVEPYMLPVEMENRIRHFMVNMGLVFACFEFIADGDENHIFVEMNEQGQFLWIEEYNPGFKILDIFTNFLLTRSRTFRWHPKQLRHKIQDYKTEMDRIIAEHRWRH